MRSVGQPVCRERVPLNYFGTNFASNIGFPTSWCIMVSRTVVIHDRFGNEFQPAVTACMCEIFISKIPKQKALLVFVID